MPKQICSNIWAMLVGRYGHFGLGLKGNARVWHLAATLVVTTVGGAYRLYKRWKSRTQLGPGKVVVITGCDSGLGYSLALHLREFKTTVVAGVLDPDGPAAIDLARTGVKVRQLDLTDAQSVQDFGDALQEILDEDSLELLALVNNAGVMIFGEFEWLLADQIKLQLEVNVLGTMSITRQLLPMLRRYKGRVVNVTSHCALAPLPGLAIYGASKAALEAWSTALRVEVRKYGLSVVTFIPGSFTKESNLLARQKQYLDDMRNGMSEEVRLFYGDYFERYATYVGYQADNIGLRRLKNRGVYDIFYGALLDNHPSSTYKCEPWRYTFYHTLFWIAPTRARDWLVERFMKMPVWHEEEAAS